MATYRTVQISFWTDPKVDDEFTPEDKYFYLYLLTNPHTNLCGCYEISMRQMVRETGYNEDTVRRLLARMESVHKVIQYDPSTKEVFILRWGKYNWSDSAATKAGVTRVAHHIKSEAFRKQFQDLGYIDPPEGAYRGPICPPGASVTVPITDTDISTISTSSKIPTLDMVREYCRERGNNIDPEQWYDFYQSKGWMVGKNKMKDWKAAVRTWEKRDGGVQAKPGRYDGLARLMEANKG